jgi:hypothetical protein
MQTPFVENDGGRSRYFKGKDVGDCVARAVAIASGRDYKEVYDRLAEGNANQRKSKRTRRSRAVGRKTAAHGINVKRKWFKDLMKEWGFEWVPAMQIGSGCSTHLCAKELPSGRLVVSVTKHVTAMIDGVIHDTWNPSRVESRPYMGDPLLSNEWRTPSNGMVHAEKRCVYGYWILKVD